MVSGIACSLEKDDILKDWAWMEKCLMPTLESFESDEEEITEFVKCKVESMIAQQLSSQESNLSSSLLDNNDSKSFKLQSHKFHQVFVMPPEEKLVNCEIC